MLARVQLVNLCLYGNFYLCFNDNIGQAVDDHAADSIQETDTDCDSEKTN